MELQNYSCSAHTEAGLNCKHSATYQTADGRRYCAQHAQQLNAGRPVSRPLATRIPAEPPLRLGWAQATFADGQPKPDGVWHGFEERGRQANKAVHKALCGLSFPSIGPRRQISPPFEAADPGVCYYCRMALVRRQIEATAAALPRRP